MNDRAGLVVVLSRIHANDLQRLLREFSVMPTRVKGDDVELLVDGLLEGQVDFNEVSRFVGADNARDMCDEAGVPIGSTKKENVQALLRWFEESFLGGAKERGRQRQPDAPDAEPEGPPSTADVLDEYECEVGATLLEDEPEDRAYQAEALEELSDAFTRYRRVVLSLPTGAGKTFVAAKWLADNLQGGAKALWLTHRAELVKQAEDELRKVFGPKRRITRWTSDEKDDSGEVVIATVGCQNKPSGPFRILLVDEAHHRAARTYREWAKTYRFELELGLTATPERHDQQKLGYEHVVKRAFWDLVAQRYLAAPIHHVVKTHEHYDLRRDRIRDDFEEASLKQLDNPRRNQFIVQQYLSRHADYRKTLIFAINVAHAEALVAEFKRSAPAIRIANILGTTDQAERRRVVEAFEQGKLDVLVNCKVFVEGFNCRDIETVFLTRPTMSAVLYCQMVGRGTRITGNKKTFHLVDFEDQLSQFSDKLAGFWCLGTKDAEEIREATERAEARPADVPILLPPAQAAQWSADLHLLGGVLAYWDAAGLMQGATLVYKNEVDAVAGAMRPDGAGETRPRLVCGHGVLCSHSMSCASSNRADPCAACRAYARVAGYETVDRAALQAAILSGHWTSEEKRFYFRCIDEGLKFHLYDFRRPDAAPPPTAPAAVAAIHATTRQVGPLSRVEAFLGTPNLIDWGGDPGEWRREFLTQQRRIAGVLRIVDDFSGRVIPQKVFDVEAKKLRMALSEVELARGMSGDTFYGVQAEAYATHLKGTSITEYRWLCVAKAALKDVPTYLDLREEV